MHPEFGMGVEFASKTLEHRSVMEAVIGRLTLTHDLVPEVLVEPEGLDWGNNVEALSEGSSVPTETEELEDPLLELFHTGACCLRSSFRWNWRSSDDRLQIVTRNENGQSKSL